MSLITRKEKFLIIGSNSFSGAHFVNGLLKRGYKVWGTSRSEQPKKEFLPYFWGDINDFTIKDNCENFLFRPFDLNNDIKGLIRFIDDIEPDMDLISVLTLNLNNIESDRNLASNLTLNLT